MDLRNLILIILIILPISLSAETHVSGEVWGVWGPEGNPYIVDSTLVIPNRQVLTLEAGVEVYFSGPDSLKVFGTFNAFGTENDSIIITHISEDYWRGIWFDSPDDTCRFEYCSVTHFTEGFDIDYGSLTVSNSFILEDFDITVTDIFDASHSFLRLSDCTILNYPGYGRIETYYSSLEVINNTFEQLMVYPIYTNVIITGNTMTTSVFSIEAIYTTSVYAEISGNIIYGDIRLISASGFFNNNFVGGDLDIFYCSDFECMGNEPIADDFELWIYGSNGIECFYNIFITEGNGIEIYNSSSVHCSENTIYAGWHGLRLNGNSDDILCENNSIYMDNSLPVLITDCDPLIQNNVLYTTSTFYPVIECRDYASPQIISNSLFGNGIECHYSDPIIKNNILLGEDGIVCFSGSAPIIDYNCLWTENNYEGCEPGENDIIADPLFIGGEPFDFYLQPMSPCIDTGDPSLPLDPDSTLPDRGALYFDHNVWVDNYPSIAPNRPMFIDCYPNPFNPATELTYTLPSSGEVSLTIYDIQGREVDVLFDGFQSAGSYKITWNAGNLPSGIYFARLSTANGQTQTQKLVLMK